MLQFFSTIFTVGIFLALVSGMVLTSGYILDVRDKDDIGTEERASVSDGDYRVAEKTFTRSSSRGKAETKQYATSDRGTAFNLRDIASHTLITDKHQLAIESFYIDENFIRAPPLMN